MKSVLIFGIGGFVGQYLAQEFLDNNYSVYGSDIGRREGLQEEIKFYQIDLMNSDIVTRLINDILPNIIINLAAVSNVGVSWDIPQTTMSINVIGALNVMEAGRKCNPMPKIMFIGSSEEYEESNKPINEEHPLNSNNPYGISKITQEKFAEVYRKRYGMQIYCVRAFNHTGIGQRDSFVLPSFCKQVAAIEKSKKSGVLTVGNLSIARDFSNVKDIVRAYRIIVESDDCEKIFNVGSGKIYTLHQILDFIISLSSQQIAIEVDPSRFRYADNPVVCCDYSYIKSELGWEPEYSIFDTLKEMFEYYNRLSDLD